MLLRIRNEYSNKGTLGGKIMNDYADKILDELTRLGVSVMQDFNLGLMTRNINIISVVPVIWIYDRYASGIYDAKKLLEHLQNLKVEDVSLESIWQHLNDFEL
jgi:hypothetical protein